jgi:endonuclease-8
MVDATIQRCEGRDPKLDAASLVGGCVTAIESRGKHLLMHFDDQRCLHSHLGMTGSWHVYAVGQTWRKPASRAAIAVYLNTTVCVCFSPKMLELLSPAGLRRHRLLSRLGPDLLAGQPDMAEILPRLRAHNPTPIGEAVMNQSIMCGIGNVYKSETLFLCRLDPFVRVGQLVDSDLVRVMDTARSLMMKNLRGYPRRTRHASDGNRLWVYGRHDKPCFVCGQIIRMRRQGDLGRSTYWCPTCQRAATMTSTKLGG